MNINCPCFLRHSQDVFDAGLRTDSTLIHLSLWLTRLWLNPDSTQILTDSTLTWLIWVRVDSTIHDGLLNGAHNCWPGRGGGLVLPVGCICRTYFSQLYRLTETITAIFQENEWFNLNSSGFQFTQFWLKHQSPWLDSDSTQLLFLLIRFWLDSFGVTVV